MLEAKHDLRIDRMLDPERAVLVEFRDALLQRDEILARRVGGCAHEVKDRPLRGSVVPRGERGPCLSLRCSGVEKPREGGHSRECAQHKAAARSFGT